MQPAERSYPWPNGYGVRCMMLLSSSYGAPSGAVRRLGAFGRDTTRAGAEGYRTL